MRNLYAILTILLFSMTSLIAQSGTESGTAFKHTTTFGVSLGQSSLWADDDNRTSSFAINPYVMRRLNRNWQLGLCLGYERAVSDIRSINSISNTPGSVGWGDVLDGLNYGGSYTGASSSDKIENTYTQLSTCVFGRFTVNPRNRLLAFLQPSLSYGRGKIELDASDSPSQGFIPNDVFTQNIDLGTRLGLTYSFNEHWQLTVLAGYLGYNLSSSKNDRDDQFERDNSGSQTDFSFNSLRLAVEFSL